MKSSAKYSSLLPPLAIVLACATAGFIAARALWSEAVSDSPPPTSASSAPDLANETTPAPPGNIQSPQHSASVPTSLENLRTALADHDLLRGADAALAWLEASTLEDQRAFIAGLKDLLPTARSGMSKEFQDAFLDAFVERWLTLAPGDFALLRDAPDRWALQDAAARVRPELVLAEIFQSSGGSGFQRTVTAAFEALAEHNPTAARAFLDKVSEPTQRRTYEHSIIRGLAQSDVFSAAALLPATEKPESDYLFITTATTLVLAAERGGPGVLRQLFAESGAKLEKYPNLPSLLLRYPDLRADFAEREGKQSGNYFDRFLDAEAVSPETRAQLLANYEQLPTHGRDQLVIALVSAWARTEPQAAADWGLAHAKANENYIAENGAIRSAFFQWMRTDSAGAIAWWEQMPDSILRSSLGVYSGTRLAHQGDFVAALKVFGPGPGTEGMIDQDATRHFAQLYSKHDPDAAAAWLATLPGKTAESAADAVTRGLYQRDPDAAIGWMETLPDGPVRERAARQFVESADEYDPAGAAARVERITDSALRIRLTRSVANGWHSDDPAAARAWVAKQPGLDETWRAGFLRQ